MPNPWDGIRGSTIVDSNGLHGQCVNCHTSVDFTARTSSYTVPKSLSNVSQDLVMLGRLTRTPGLHGPGMSALVREFNSNVRSIDRKQSTLDEASESALQLRGMAVAKCAEAKVQLCRRLAKIIHPHMIRRGPHSLDRRGQPLIDLPRRYNILVKLIQNDHEREAVQRAINGIDDK